VVYFLISWDPKVSLSLAGIPNPVVDDGKGLFLWWEELDNIL